MNALKKVQHDCRKATFLLEKKQFGKISLREKIELRIHLAGCSVCRIFSQQTGMISRMVTELLRQSPPPAEMNASDKIKLQQLIEKELEKKSVNSCKE